MHLQHFTACKIAIILQIDIKRRFFQQANKFCKRYSFINAALFRNTNSNEILDGYIVSIYLKNNFAVFQLISHFSMLIGYPKAFRKFERDCIFAKFYLVYLAVMQLIFHTFSFLARQTTLSTCPVAGKRSKGKTSLAEKPSSPKRTVSRERVCGLQET